MKQWFKNYSHRLLLFSLLMAAGFLLILSKCSPLYPMNDSVDVNCFFTMGRSILHGIVPYRDLYEQKGPVLYFLYALAALISEHSFFGVYLLEIVTFGLFLYFSGKIAEIYLGQCKAVFFIVAVLAAVIPVSPAFAHGGGAEEVSLFMLAYGLYSVLKALHKKRLLSFWEAFLNGAFAAMVLYIKFTMVGFYMGLALFVIIWYLSAELQWKQLLITIGQFLLGVAAVSAVVFGYFLIYGAVEDFLTVYFYNNLFLYPVELDGTRQELIWNSLKRTLEVNPSYAWCIYLSLLLFFLECRKNWRDLPMALLCFAGLVIGTYWGGRGYTYYGLILAVFAVFGLIAIFRLCRAIGLSQWVKKLLTDVPLVSGIAVFISIAVLFSYSWHNGRNVWMMAYSKADMPAYRFAETIHQVEDAKILNLGFLDGGFYYAADVLPNCKYFCTLNINTPDMWELQRECIRNGVDFVITRNYPLSRYSGKAYAYKLVDEASFWFEGWEYTYYLYQKKY